MAYAALAGIWFDPREPAPPNADLPANYYHQAKHLQHSPPGFMNTASFHTAHNYMSPVWPAPEAPQTPQPTRQFLAPRLTTVKVNVIHDAATFTVVQYFENKSNVAGQGKYQFPLPHDASVTEFTCRVNNDKVIRAKVKEKEQARREFDAAVRQGRVGGIVEQETVEIFTTTLANIPAHAQMRAELTFMSFLKHRAADDHETFTLTIPTFIASRYGQAPHGVSAHPSGTGPKYTVNVDVLATEKITAISSQTHDLYWSQGVGQRKCQTWDDFTKVSADNGIDDSRCATVQLREENTNPDKDIVIDIATQLPNMTGVPQAIVETHPTLSNSKAVMVTLPSDMMLNTWEATSDGEIVFLADRSGSMGDKMSSLISAMNYFIHGIPGNRLFNIWCFGSTATSLWGKSKPLNADTMAEALAYVEQFRSNMGGTAILGAIRRICQARDTKVPLDVVVLTDGQVWNASETTNFVKEETKLAEGKVRFFSLGIGTAVSHDLVEGIAKAGGGYAEIIVNANVPTWQDRVVAMLGAASTCHVTNVHVEPIWDVDENDVQPPTPTYKQSPPTSAPVYLFTRSRFFWLFEEGGEQLPPLKSVRLEISKLDGTTFAKVIPIKQASAPDSKIHILAARALLGDLESRASSAFSEAASCRAQGVQLGCKWSLVSKWTSLYAVEEDIPTSTSSEKQVMPHTYEHDDPLLKQHVSASNNLKWIFQQFVTQRAHTMPSLSGRVVRELADARPSVPALPDIFGDASMGSIGLMGTPCFMMPPDSAESATLGAYVPMTPSSRMTKDVPQSSELTCMSPASESALPKKRGRPSREDKVDWSKIPMAKGPSGSSPWDRPRSIAMKSPSVDVPAAASTARGCSPLSEFYADPAASGDRVASFRPKSSTSRAGRKGPLSDSLKESARYARCARPEANARSSESDNSAARGGTTKRAARASPSDSESDSDLVSEVGASLRRRRGPLAADTSAQPVSGDASVAGRDAPANDMITSYRCSSFGNDLTLSSPNFTKSPSSTKQGGDEYILQGNSFGLSRNLDFDAPPAATVNSASPRAFVNDDSTTYKSPEVVAAESFVHSLLPFQTYDGKFDFRTHDSIQATMGPSMLQLVLSLCKAGFTFEMAATIVVLALLKGQFLNCRKLWMLMERKGIAYLGSRSAELNKAALLEIQSTREKIRTMESVLQELERIKNGAGPVVELEVAPIAN